MTLVAGVGLSLVPAPQHPHQARWQPSPTVGSALPWEQEEKWVHTVTPSLAGTCTAVPSPPSSHPIQTLRLIGTCVDDVSASPANSSKELKGCPRGSHHQDQPTLLVLSPGGEEGCQGVRLQRKRASPRGLYLLQICPTALP